MSMQKKITKRGERRSFRVRNSLRLINREGRLRVTIFRSNRFITAQIIDDSQSKTLMSLSSSQLGDVKGDKSAVAKLVGVELGKRAVAQNISEVMFDRGSYLYHGRVKAVAEGLRESGLQF
ncbi:MAG: large subunit ribosomal protein [Candidatus Dependentiae bacterium]|nr:large subunit ribosomal protein [Candidatus Dependentiae bacterium]